MSRSIESHAMIHCAYFFATRIPGTEIISFTRTSLTVKSSDELEAEMGAFEEHWAHVLREEHDVLLDLRAEPTLEDAELQKAYRDRRDALVRGFRRAAVLSTRDEERSHFEAAFPSIGSDARLFSAEGAAFDWLGS